MLDLFSTAQQNLQSPLSGETARAVEPSTTDAFTAAREANTRVDGLDAEYQNQRDFLRQRMGDFTTRTGVVLPAQQDVQGEAGDFSDNAWIAAVRAKMQTTSQERNDPTLAPPSDSDIAIGGLDLARGAARRQAELSRGPTTFGALSGSAAAGALSSAQDPLNVISLSLAPTGGPLLSTALRMGGVMAAQSLAGDALRYGYRQQVNPDYGLKDVAGDVAGSFASGALFGAGAAVGGHGVRGTLMAAGAGAIGGAALGGMQNGVPGAVEGALGGAALPAAGAAFGLGAKSLGMAWRGLRETRPEVAADMPLEVRDAGAVAEKAGDLQAQNVWPGAAGDAAHAEAIGKIEADLRAAASPELPASAQVEAAARRGQVFYPGGVIDARYDLAEHADLITSHDADFRVRPDYPAELQPRDRSGAPAQDQVNAIAADLQPDRLGPSPEANAGAPIVGPDGVVESGNGRALAIGRAYDLDRGDAYRQHLERLGYDTTGYAKPVLVGVRETPMDPAARADFAHAANGSASLRMSATEQALSDARHLDGDTLALAKSSDLTAAANRDFARAMVAKLPAGERGGMLTRDGDLSAGGVARMRAAITARAYGDVGVLARALDHPDPNIKAVAGALGDAAAPWARMRDAATRGDIASGHDITPDVLQAVKAIMRARDEGRPPWEVLNQGDIFQSDTTQLASRMFFRDEQMRQPAGRARVAEALTSYAEEAAKNTTAGRLFDDAVSPVDVLRRMSAATVETIGGMFDTAAHDVLAMIRQTPENSDPLARERAGAISDRPAGETQPNLALRNTRTGASAQAQSVASLKDMLARHSAAGDITADPLTRASSLAMGSRLAKIVGDMPVFTVGPAEMRTLGESRIKMQVGFEPAGFYDPKAGHIVVLDDALRDPSEASRLMIHEGLHGAFMRTINESESARNVIDQLRDTALASHFERGGEASDHYGLTNAHEFVSEGFSNPEFQRFLASIPADARMVEAFGLDKAPGYSLWDVFVAAVRKILGMAPDQHTLLDATMRLGQILDGLRQEQMRAPGYDIAPMMRPIQSELPPRTPEEEAARARQFANVKDAISYRINSDRIAQHPNGPLAGFLGILTRDIHEKGGINVESVQQVYEGRMAEAVEKILEPYGSKMAGLKQDVAGIRDVIREVFGVDTGNETAKTAAHAWSEGIDKFATDEAKRLGKVFTPAEDWRVPQFWESSRAQKFGKAALLEDMRREIDGGGLKVLDPDTHEEANALRREAILDGAADKIVTDASLGGTPGASGSFRTDMRVFRFADGEAGADSYLKLMDKYGAGRGGYLQMMQAHVGKVSRELGLSRVLGPGWADVGEKLLRDTLLADKKLEANKAPRTAAERLRDLPVDTGRFLTRWLESPTKAEVVWQHMSGQASGIGSELMAGLLSETRSFMTATRMGSAIVTAVPADTVNWLMAAKHNGMDMGRMVTAITDAFLKDNPDRREEAARLGIVAHAGTDAAIGTKRFEDQYVGDKLFKRMSDFVIRAQGLHAWDSAIKRAFPMEFLGTIAQRAGRAFGDLDEPFARFLDRYKFTEDDWQHLGNIENAIDTGAAKFLLPDKLPEDLRVKLMSAINDERQFAYLAGGSERVRAMSAGAKAGTFAGEVTRSIFLFKSFPMTMLATWGMRAAHEAGNGRIATLATLVTGMTMAGALAMQARAVLQGKDPRSMKDPFFWGESFLQGGAAGIYGDFFKEAFSRSDTSLTETALGPLSVIPASIQGLTSGARRAAESGEKVNFGSKLARIISQNTPGGNLWYTRLIVSRLMFDNIQRMIDPDYAKSFARQQQRALKTDHQGFFWAPGQNAPGRAPDPGAMFSSR